MTDGDAVLSGYGGVRYAEVWDPYFPVGNWESEVGVAYYRWGRGGSCRGLYVRFYEVAKFSNKSLMRFSGTSSVESDFLTKDRKRIMRR
jgi:hypothetical protein